MTLPETPDPNVIVLRLSRADAGTLSTVLLLSYLDDRQEALLVQDEDPGHAEFLRRSALDTLRLRDLVRDALIGQ